MNILLIFISVFLNCFGQLLIRKGMTNLPPISFHTLYNILFLMLQNLWLWLAIFCYIISLIIWMIVLSRVEVSYAFPLGSFGYVIVAVAGYFFLDENVTFLRFLGISIICLGVYVVSRS